MKPIASAIPGRIRIRTPASLPHAELARLESALRDLEAVTSTRVNASAASIVVEYDASRIGLQDMVAQLSSLAGFAPVPAAASPQKALRFSRSQVNRYAKYGALASLGLSLALAAAGKKRWHAITGGVFLAFLAAHMTVHRRHMLR